MKAAIMKMTRSQHFSIFYCGCKQPNFSTSVFRAAKVRKKIKYAIYVLLMVNMFSKCPSNFGKVIKYIIFAGLKLYYNY